MAAFLAVILPASTALAAEVPPISVLSVSFSDALHGYLAGGYTGSDGVVAVTSDGGQTWSPKQKADRRFWAIASGANGTNGSAFADYFDEEYRTTNSSGAWVTNSSVFGAELGYAGTGTHITDGAYLTNGRVAVGKREGTIWGNLATIAQNTGGSTWVRKYYPAQVVDSNGDPIKVYGAFNSVDAIANGNVAWAVGANYSDQQNSTVAQTLIYRTIDGGTTWANDAPAVMINDLSDVAAVNTDVAYAIARASTGLGSQVASTGARRAWMGAVAQQHRTASQPRLPQRDRRLRRGSRCRGRRHADSSHRQQRLLHR